MKNNKVCYESSLMMNLVMIKEVQIYDFEMRMRKMITELLAPSLEKMTRDKENSANLVKTSGELVNRMATLEEAVYN
jgi:hypothetical protein